MPFPWVTCTHVDTQQGQLIAGVCLPCGYTPPHSITCAVQILLCSTRLVAAQSDVHTLMSMHTGGATDVQRTQQCTFTVTEPNASRASQAELEIYQYR
jgi:hypothetical protein